MENSGFLGNMGLSFWLINVGIIIFGALVWVKLGSLHKQAVNIHKKAKDKSRTVKGEEILDIANSMMGYSVQNSFNPTSMDDVRDDYNKVSASFYTWTQLISLFPLLGLFGTVFGIIPGLMQIQTGDFTALQSSLSTALFSTLVGLVCSIALKGAAAKYSMTLMGVEDYFEEFDRKYNMALNYQRVINSNVKDETND